MESKLKYAPNLELIDALTQPPKRPRGRPPKDKNAEVLEILHEKAQVVRDYENTQLAISHIKDTLDALKDLLQELREMAPASQSPQLFQTASILSKTRLDGANMLANLCNGSEKKEKKESSATPAKSNHLHLNVTSAQFGELIATQVKRAKDGIEE